MTYATALASLLLVSCADPSGGFRSRPVPTPDLNVEVLAAGGCLDLAGAFNQLRGVPQGMHVRKHLRNLSLGQKTDDGKPYRRDAAAVTSLGRLVGTYADEPAGSFFADFPTVSQVACESVTFTDQLGASRTMKVTPTPERNQLHLVNEDGHEFVYLLKSPREVEIIIKESVKDRCPPFANSQATQVEVMAWGTQGELARVGVQVSRDLIRLIAYAAVAMPDGLMGLVTQDAAELVDARPEDILSLRAANVEPTIDRCPYRAKPPTGDEPPPPPDDSGGASDV